MVTRMLVDASHAEETRVVVVKGNRLEEFDYEAAAKKQLKGNIYLARITRVEPSLQAAFVEYGGNRHGFLAFSEIHPDYYQIPQEDRDELTRQQLEETQALQARDNSDDDGVSEDGGDVSQLGGEDDTEDRPKSKDISKKYRIQEVIKRRQVLLIQVVKEERGNKGAALTTYLSLAGRYSVLMPNTARGGGISRKISKPDARKKLKEIIREMEVPRGMGVIVRTAGMNRTKTEIRRDYEYLLRLWEDIRQNTLAATAPELVYEEANLIKRSIRDVYSKDVDEILVEGEEGYRIAKDFMKQLVPSHAKRVQPYKDTIPLFHRYQVEGQLAAMHDTSVELKSGGYIVLNPTEALVSIDVNSGKSTKEKNIEETALKTNLEAAEEIARQVRLRDLAGLVVIDFIDMEEPQNNRSVERRLKDCLRTDRARIQLGNISAFGLLEMSRQRLRPSLVEASGNICPHCSGSGVVRSTENIALQILRLIEEEGIRGRTTELTGFVPPEIALYVLNHKRERLALIERRYGFKVFIAADIALNTDDCHFDRVGGKPEFQNAEKDDESPSDEAREDSETRTEARSGTRSDARSNTRKERDTRDDVSSDDSDANDDGDRKRKRRRRRRRRRPNEDQSASLGQENGLGQEDAAEASQSASDTDTEGHTSENQADHQNGPSSDDDDQQERPGRRRRGRRGGRRRRGADGEDEQNTDSADSQNADSQPQSASDSEASKGTSHTPSSEVSGDNTQSPPVNTNEDAARTVQEIPIASGAPVAPESTSGAPAKATPAVSAPVETSASPTAPAARESNETTAQAEAVSTSQTESAPVEEKTPEPPKRKRTGWWSRALGGGD